MQDLLFETIAFQRIAFVAKLASTSQCTEDEKELALIWLNELTVELTKRLDKFEEENPQCKGGSRCSGGFQ